MMNVTRVANGCVGLALALSLAAQRSAAQSDLPQPIACRELRRFDAPEAKQGVAVGVEHFFAIGNRVIAKYDKHSGERIKRWSAKNSPIMHLNSGVVRDGRLYCAHSNFPEFPEISSVEVWDANSLEHVASHSFGIYEGSLTWIDWHDGSWWAVFAHYTERVNENPHARDARWTSLVRFDAEWRRTAGWVFPRDVVARFEPHSCSGGGWGRDGRLFATGHDHGELYELALPTAGSTLQRRVTYALPITGQGIAWDLDQPGILYGIDRPKGQIVVVQVPNQSVAAQPATTPPAPPR